MGRSRMKTAAVRDADKGLKAKDVHPHDGGSCTRHCASLMHIIHENEHSLHLPHEWI
jgi:hypothetical protein